MNRPRRIGLIMQGGAAWIGGSEYIRNLVLACGGLPTEERAGIEIHLISGTALTEELAASLRPHLAGVHILSSDLPSATLPNRARWLFDRHLRGRLNTRFAEFIARERFDFLYPLTYDNQYNIGLALPLRGALGACRWAGWIPDFQHRCLPELFSAGEIAKRDAGISALVAEARTIVFSSESAAADFRRFYPGATAHPKVLHFHTTPNPDWFAGDPLAVQRRYSLPDEFFLVSNQLWQHKNHLVVFEALQRLAGRGVFATVVCTGSPHDFRNKDYLNTVLRRIHELGVAKQVCLLGLIPRADQIQLMRRALAVIQPSFFEGWSTVVEDARVLGKPMILSDISVHCEQAPERARYFPGDSPERLAEQIDDCMATCAPGPFLEDEARARTEATEKTKKFGRRFLQIVEAA
jgi:glycosyltransferase involved in cell wall biosynthesis